MDLSMSPEGFEPPTLASAELRSIQLSYGPYQLSLSFRFSRSLITVGSELLNYLGNLYFCRYVDSIILQDK